MVIRNTVDWILLWMAAFRSFRMARFVEVVEFLSACFLSDHLFIATCSKRWPRHVCGAFNPHLQFRFTPRK